MNFTNLTQYYTLKLPSNLTTMLMEIQFYSAQILECISLDNFIIGLTGIGIITVLSILLAMEQANTDNIETNKVILTTSQISKKRKRTITDVDLYTHRLENSVRTRFVYNAKSDDDGSWRGAWIDLLRGGDGLQGETVILKERYITKPDGTIVLKKGLQFQVSDRSQHDTYSWIASKFVKNNAFMLGYNFTSNNLPLEYKPRRNFAKVFKDAFTLAWEAENAKKAKEYEQARTNSSNISTSSSTNNKQ